MLFQPEHEHQQIHSKTLTQIVMEDLLQCSKIGIGDVSQDIADLRRFEEEKVYLSYSNDSNQYLQHMLHKTSSDTQEFVLQKINQREFQVLTDIRHNKYKLTQIKEQDKIKKIREELSDKINDMKSSMLNLKPSHLDNETDQGYKKIMQFRKKGYWKQESEEGQKAKKFLAKMRKERRRIEQEHLKQLQKNEKNLKAFEEQERNEKEQEAKKSHEEKLERLKKMKDEKQKKEDERKKKKEQAAALVKKYKNSQPIYLINAERFKNQVLIPMEEERNKKLTEWKKSRRPIDAEELELHQQWYQEFKQKHNNAADRKQQDLEIQQRNMERLNQLFHGKFHQNITKQPNPLQYDYDSRKKHREKVLSYSLSVRDEHKPNQDRKKKEQLESLINLLEERKNKGKKKVQKEDGSIVYEDFSSQKRHQIGRSYLDHLRSFNAGRKIINSEDKSQSNVNISERPVYQDYLREQRAKSQKTQGQLKTRQGLRKIVNSVGSARDRYQTTMEHLSVFENEAKRKQLQLKYMKGRRSMELRSELDKYYIDSASMNLQMLKQVVEK